MTGRTGPYYGTQGASNSTNTGITGNGMMPVLAGLPPAGKNKTKAPSTPSANQATRSERLSSAGGGVSFPKITNSGVFNNG